MVKDDLYQEEFELWNLTRHTSRTTQASTTEEESSPGVMTVDPILDLDLPAWTHGVM